MCHTHRHNHHRSWSGVRQTGGKKVQRQSRTSALILAFWKSAFTALCGIDIMWFLLWYYCIGLSENVFNGHRKRKHVTGIDIFPAVAKFLNHHPAGLLVGPAGCDQKPLFSCHDLSPPYLALLSLSSLCSVCFLQRTAVCPVTPVAVTSRVSCPSHTCKTLHTHTRPHEHKINLQLAFWMSHQTQRRSARAEWQTAGE